MERKIVQLFSVLIILIIIQPLLLIPAFSTEAADAKSGNGGQDVKDEGGKNFAAATSNSAVSSEPSAETKSADSAAKPAEAKAVAEEPKTADGGSSPAAVKPADGSDKPHVATGSYDFSEETLQSTRSMISKSKACTTFFLMYSRSEDIQKTLAAVFEAEMSGGDVKISENSVTNSIIVKLKDAANDQLIKDIEHVIRSLDCRQGQVLIDVLVVELSISDEDAFDFELKLLSENALGIKDAINSTAIDQGSIDKRDPTLLATGFKSFITSQNKLKMFINAAQTKGKVHVVSSPHIVAANHRQAVFKIGEKVPLIQSIRPSDAGPIKTFDVKEVGLELTVTPHINRGGQIDMEIKQIINAISQYDFTQGTARMTNREAQTNVTILDGETVVLGGFIEDKRRKTEKKIPLLSQIPLLGKAFENRSNLNDKTELMVFISPKVMDTNEDSQKVTNQQKSRLQMKDEVTQILKDRAKTPPDITPNQEIIVDRRSYDWLYDFNKEADKDWIDVVVWQVPSKLDPNSLKLTRKGSCPFGFGASKRLSPPYIKTYLEPCDGVILKKDFNIDDPIRYKNLAIKVASNNAAVVYINGRLVDEDPAIKLRDGHDYEYWNRTRDDIPGAILHKGINNLVVLLGNDKSTTDAYFDMMLIGSR